MHIQGHNHKAAYHTVVSTPNGRIGELRLSTNNRKLTTPAIYPVISFLTGTSPRGGGIWKYLLRDFMQRDYQMLSQVLHFLDFNFTGKYLANWRKKSMRENYREQNGDYKGTLFLDSGGFKLLYNAGLELSEFGIHKETEADDILALQLDFGGDIVASLDYPLPPNLVRAEADIRMAQSLQNAIRAAELLTDKADKPPYLYICCHGQSQEDISNYTAQVFEQVGDKLPSFGLAVGSLVPLRGRDDSAVMERIRGVVEAIPEARRDTTPIHAFGVSGVLTPVLAYLGVDSFDSTTYIQTARSLFYAQPDTQRKLKILEMDTITCDCYVCQQYPLDEMQQALMEEQSYQVTSTGKYKSEYYAAIALHNFEMETRMLAEMCEGIQADDAVEALAEHIGKYQHNRGTHEAIGWLAENDTELGIRLTRTLIHNPTRKEKIFRDPNQLELFSLDYETPENATTLIAEDATETISLSYTPDDFSVPADYEPPADKNILLVIPCAGKKPYSLSRTHTIVAKKLVAVFGEKQQHIHKVTLSGLYGPVPAEFETEEAVTRYDFQLSPHNGAQIELCTKRLLAYLEKYGTSYTLCVGYATSRAYREVMSLAEKRYRRFILMPKSLKQKRLSEFFRHAHLDALVELIQEKGEIEGSDSTSE